MRLMGEIKNKKSRVAVTVWDREGNVSKDDKKSLTFTVEDTTMDELATFLKNAVRREATGLGD